MQTKNLFQCADCFSPIVVTNSSSLNPDNNWGIFGLRTEAQGFSADDYNDSESVEILDLAKLWCRAMGACEWCGKKLSATESEPDHLIPLSKGGSNNHTNIVLCCSKCNGRKATKHPACFAAEQKAQGISTPLIETYLKRYKNNPGVQQILSADFGLS